jgi:hypothetical protein
VGAIGLALPALLVGLLLFLLAVLVAARIYCMFVLSVPACVVEGTRVSESIKRGKFLSDQSLFRIFLVYFLMAIVGAILGAVLSLPNYIAQAIHKGTQALPLQIWEIFAGFLAGTLSGPIGTIAISLLYYDNRVRKEAFDLQVMMESMGQPVPVQTASAPASGA